jgi:hypothetical protein
MKRALDRGKPALDILEESVNLLRSAPGSLIVVYLTGAVPFLLALLFYLNDMTHSAFAGDHLITGSLALAVAYVWKNVWQARFAAGLHRTLSPAGERSGSWWMLILMTAALQPLSLLIPLPFPWTTAFFRDVSLFAATGHSNPIRTAARQSTMWTRQNWAILLIATLAGLVLFVNVLVLIVIIPQLGRSLLGIEGDFARAGGRILNLSTIAAAAALAWLVMDPILDGVYVLRCFYGESLATGEDLRAALRRAIAVVMMIFAILPALHAESIDPQKLDRSIEDVVHRREFAWRSPQQQAEPDGRWVSWVRSAVAMVQRGWDYVKKLIDEWFKPKQEKESAGGQAPLTRRMMALLIGLVVALIVAAGVAFYLRKRTPVVAAKAVAAVPVVNLADDSVTADQLPESSWMQLADEWIAKGDLRLAMRALHLAGLNYLGQRGLISIRKWKTGLDYRRELERRARSKPVVPQIFSDNCARFEAVWYGFNPTNRDLVGYFAYQLSEIKAKVEAPE